MKSHLATLFCRGLASVTRTIDARIPPASPGERTLYLTFDDGPHPLGTNALLDVLLRNNVPATFFLVGENARRYPELVRRIVDAGHEVGNHSQTHIDGWKASRVSVLRDYIRGSRTLTEIAGHEPIRLRPPFGKITNAVSQWAIRHRQRVTLWDVMPPDFDPRSTVKSLSRSLLRGVRPGSIVCLHDNDVAATRTPQVLADCLPRLRKEGWAFAALPEPTWSRR
jgi:peptidoglycan-N-acetylglucosamine deacetylase